MAEGRGSITTSGAQIYVPNATLDPQVTIAIGPDVTADVELERLVGV
jgi:hypothetical protein